MFKKHDAKTEAGFAAFRVELEQTLELFVQKHADLAAELNKRPSAAAFTELKDAHDDLKQRFEALYTKLDNEPGQQHQRSRATGSDAATVTDC